MQDRKLILITQISGFTNVHMELDKGFDPIVKYNLTEIVKMSFVVLKAIKCKVFCIAIALLTGS